ncbi:MAG: DNA polymerase IV [Planctomycetes bacterium]|nr:DNA polymerase IV [Planctomycetota bacterium]
MKAALGLTILHVDMDAFYAAVEVLDDPSLQGKPVIVGGPANSRSVVSSATYEARKFGVRSAMPSAQAARLCPQGIFLPGRMHRYVEISGEVMRIFRSFTPLVEPLSLDEAFLDVAGAERLFGDGPSAGRLVKEKIRKELGLVASVGVSFNKFLAKLASDLEKPDGFVVIAPGDVDRRLPPLPVSRLWGVGPKTQTRLEALGLRTIGDVRAAGEKRVVAELGDFGSHISRLARGEDDRSVEPSWDARSIGAERTFERDLASVAAMERELLELSEEVGTRLRSDAVAARTIQIKVRFPDFRTITRSRTLERPTDITTEIYETARALLRDKAGVKGSRVRLLGVQAQNLAAPGAGQGTLFGEKERAKERRLDRTIDALRQKLGEDAIVRARTRENGR